jgi:hypothetical protein
MYKRKTQMLRYTSHIGRVQLVRFLIGSDFMNRSKHSILMNAFRPAKEIDDPEFFAGRASQVARLTNSLHVIGSCPIIYGDRGLGKTSLAVQMRYIAMGHSELLESLEIGNRAFGEESRYVTFLVTCTDATRTFNDLIQVLINAAEDALDSGSRQNASTLAERTVSRKISLKAFEAERRQAIQYRNK